MKVTVCDRCKKVIYDPQEVRIVEMLIPSPRHLGDCAEPRTMEPKDRVWYKELCTECAAEISEAISKKE